MAQLLVKKYSLKYNGKIYTVGSVVAMEHSIATALAKTAPAEFELLEAGKNEVLAPAESRQAVHEDEGAGESTEKTLESMTLAELKAEAEELGIKPGKMTKAQLLKAIAEAESADQNGLPSIDGLGSVK